MPEEVPTAVPSRDQRIENAREDAENLDPHGLLTEQQSLAYVLRSLYGFDRQETAEIMDTSPSNLDNIYRRAQQNVQAAATVSQQTGKSDRSITAELGGEVGQLIHDLAGSQFLCSGCHDIHTLTAESWRGRPHDGGLMDGRGRRWWPYVRCPNESYDNSWKTVRHNRIDDADVKQAQVIIWNDLDESTLRLILRDNRGDVIERDDLDYSYFARGQEPVRSPPHTITYYDFRENATPYPVIGGNYDTPDPDETPTFTLRVEDDNDATDPFEQTYTFAELGLERKLPDEQEG